MKCELCDSGLPTIPNRIYLHEITRKYYHVCVECWHVLATLNPRGKYTCDADALAEAALADLKDDAHSKQTAADLSAGDIDSNGDALLPA